MPTRHVITEPIGVAIPRMPATLGAVALQRQPGESTWRWTGSGGAGEIQLLPRTATTSWLEVTSDGGGQCVADDVAVALYGVLERQWAPAGEARTPGLGVRSKSALAVAAVLIPALVLTGMRIMAPPAPVDVASAVSQFRQQSAAAGTAAAPTATAQDGQNKRAESSANEPARTTRSRDSVAPAPAAATTTEVRRANRSQSGGPPQSREQQPDTTATSDRRAAASEREATRAPEEGVYRYKTSGYESIDQPSSRHDYPEETPMTLRTTDCGFLIHWQPLENRWDEMTVCREGDDAFIPSMATHREFYGQEKHSQYTCSAGYYAWRPEPGATWQGRCEDAKSRIDLRARTLNREPVQVGDQTIEAVHYFVEGQLSGDNEGTWRVERWVDPETGLLVRMQGRTHATSSGGFGTVNYREETNLQLLSMTPER